MTEDRAIIFPATVNKVSTLVDGGLRLVLDLPETAVAQVAELIELKRNDRPLTVAVVPDER